MSLLNTGLGSECVFTLRSHQSDNKLGQPERHFWLPKCPSGVTFISEAWNHLIWAQICTHLGSLRKASLVLKKQWWIIIVQMISSLIFFFVLEINPYGCSWSTISCLKKSQHIEIMVEKIPNSKYWHSQSENTNLIMISRYNCYKLAI